MTDFQEMLELAQKEKIPQIRGMLNYLDVDPIEFSSIVVRLSRNFKLSQEGQDLINVHTKAGMLLSEEERFLIEIINWGCAAGYYYALKKQGEALGIEGVR